MLAIRYPENLGRSRQVVSGLSQTFLAIEGWFAERASARALYRMDDRALSDLAISRSDVERINLRARLPLWLSRAMRR
jgi:uncharacterized protein YjiS (DUF1127 family)